MQEKKTRKLKQYFLGRSRFSVEEDENEKSEGENDENILYTVQNIQS